MNNKYITVVGCGTLGASVAYKICLRSLEKEFPLDTLYLVDFDHLEVENLPYLHIGNSNSEYVGCLKCEILQELLSEINPDLNIIARNDIYPTASDDEIYDTFMIDCRDTGRTDSKFKLKANCDGSWGSIKCNPKSHDGKRSEYRYGNSRYYADKLSGYVCHTLRQFPVNSTYISINLREGVIHELY